MATVSISKSEKSYIQTSLLSAPPLRADGRALHDYRTVLLETGIAPLANGSAKVNLGKNPEDGGGGTEVLAAAKLEVENIESGAGVEGGRLACSVTCSSAAYPHLTSNALDDLQYDYTAVLHQTLSHPSLHPSNLGILPQKKSWLLNLDLVILSDSGNAYDAMFMAARAALWDTKVPVTKPVQYAAKPSPSTRPAADLMDTSQDGVERSGFDTRQVPSAADFELPDYWDEGEALAGRELWPVCITLNIHPPVHFLDATLPEEASIPLRLLLAFSFPPNGPSKVQSMRLLGSGELRLPQIQSLIADGEKFAHQLHVALEAKLRDEDLRRNQKARDKFALRYS